MGKSLIMHRIKAAQRRKHFDTNSIVNTRFEKINKGCAAAVEAGSTSVSSSHRSQSAGFGIIEQKVNAGAHGERINRNLVERSTKMIPLLRISIIKYDWPKEKDMPQAQEMSLDEKLKIGCKAAELRKAGDKKVHENNDTQKH